MPPKTRTTTRKPAARKMPARTRKPAVPDGVLVLDRPENHAAFDKLISERQPLFSVDGVVYTIPKNVPPAWSMQAMDLAMTKGEDVALAWTVGTMLGVDGYEALKTCPTLLPEDLHVVFKAIMDKVLPGGSFAPKAS